MTKMDIKQDLELVAISSDKSTQFFEVATGHKKNIANLEKEIDEEENEEEVKE